MSGGRSKPLRSTADEDEPLPEGEPEESTEAEDEPESSEDEETTDEEPAPKPRPARPPGPTFKASTFVYFFLGFLGLYMLIDTSFRTSIACSLGMVNSSCSSGPSYTSAP